MKKYIALFNAIIILSIGYVLSIHVPMPKDNATGLFAIFDYLYIEENYSNIKYINLYPQNINEEDRAELTFLMKKYCFFHGNTFLFKTFDELVDEGYIVDGKLDHGITFRFDSLEIKEGNILAEATINFDSIGYYGSELRATFENRKWTVEPTNGFWWRQ